jgi:MFS family permease
MPVVLTLSLALFNMTSMRAARVLVTLYALHLGADALTIGILAAMFAFFPMLLSYHAGKISDRYGSRRPMTIAAVVGAAGLIVPFFSPGIPALFIAASLGGLASVFYSLSLQNLVGMLSTAANRARNYSNYAMTISVANAIGPMMVGVIIDRGGYAPAFLSTSLLLAIPFLLLVFRGGILPGGHRHPPAAEAAAATPAVKRRVWPVVMASALAQSGLDVFLIYLPVYAAGHGISATAIGIIIAMTAAGGFLARLILPQMIARMGALPLFGYALLLGGACFVLVPFLSNTLALCVVAFIFGSGLNVSQPIALMVMYDRSPKGRSGAALGMRFAVDNATKLVGPMLFGAVAAVTTLGAVFWLNAVLLGLGGLVAKREEKD